MRKSKSVLCGLSAALLLSCSALAVAQAADVLNSSEYDALNYQLPSQLDSRNNAYTLTKVDSADLGSNPDENPAFIKIPVYDKASGNIVDEYYKIDIHAKDYGGDENGTTQVIDVKLPNKDTPFAQIEYKIDDTQGQKSQVNVSTVPADEGTYYEGGAYLNVGDSVDYGDIGSVDDKKIIQNNQTFLTYTGGDASDTKNLYVQGGAIYNNGNIGDIYADFIGNYLDYNINDAKNVSAYVYGGAIYNNDKGNINNIYGNFINNIAYSGGAIYNDFGTWDTHMVGDFIGNQAITGGAIDNGSGTWNGETNGNFIANSAQIAGGAIVNTQNWTGNINGDFIGNTAGMNGGAIVNSQNWTGNINGDFIGNSAVSGGAIQNYGTWSGNIDGDFINNSAETAGGAIHNSGTLVLTNNNFYNNTVKTSQDASSLQTDVGGGAIFASKDLTVRAEGAQGTSIFRGNKVTYKGDDGRDITKSEAIALDDTELKLEAVNGGLVQFDDGIRWLENNNNSKITVTGDENSSVVFNNTLENIKTMDVNSGRVFFNTINGQELSKIDYTLNLNDGEVHNAIITAGGSLIAQTQTLINNLEAQANSNLQLENGTTLNGDVIIDAQANLSGSYDFSQIFKDDGSADGDGSLTLVGGLNAGLNESSLLNNAKNKKLVLSGGTYELGKTTANSLAGWQEIDVADGAVLKIEKDILMDKNESQNINIMNGSELNLSGNSPTDYTIDGNLVNNGSVNFSHSGDGADDITTVTGNYVAQNNATMTIDVDTATNTADMLIVQGDVQGKTGVIINPSDDNLVTKKVPFVEALNDNLDTAAYFEVTRVMRDAHVWNIYYADNIWYTGTDNVIGDSNNNGYGDLPTGGDSDTQLYPEALGYLSLPVAAIEQTRSLTQNVTDSVASAKIYYPMCNSSYDCNYTGDILYHAWASAAQDQGEIKSPAEFDVDISGFEGGIDAQINNNNRLGVFASFRQGNYDLSGKGKDYYSKDGTEIDIDSYVLGLYHRYDRGPWWLMTTVFGGLQKAKIQTDDGMVSEDVDGFEFGGSIEGGHSIALSDSVLLTPSLKVAYTQIDYDNIHDNLDKTVQFDDINELSFEAGIKAEKTFMYEYSKAKLYIKPSIIQTIGKGDIQVSSLQATKALDNMTLGRLAVGGSLSLNNRWNAYASTGYTLGEDYQSWNIEGGLGYTW